MWFETSLEDILNLSSNNLSNGGGLKKLQRFQESISAYKIILCNDLNPDRLMFVGNSVSAKILYLLYNLDSGHYNAIKTFKLQCTRSM